MTGLSPKLKALAGKNHYFSVAWCGPTPLATGENSEACPVAFCRYIDTPAFRGDLRSGGGTIRLRVELQFVSGLRVPCRSGSMPWVSPASPCSISARSRAYRCRPGSSPRTAIAPGPETIPRWPGYKCVWLACRINVMGERSRAAGLPVRRPVSALRARDR